MTCICPVIALSPRDYDAVWFDLDGVRTRTASMDAVAWKKLFDGFLERRSADTGQPFAPCDIDADFRRYVTASRVTTAWRPISSGTCATITSSTGSTSPGMERTSQRFAIGCGTIP